MFLLWLILPVLTLAKGALRPNVILIIADDLGYYDVGYHGSEIRTPNIDYLANEGVKLEDYYVQPTCSPSRSELLTGRYGMHTGYYGMTILSKSGVPLQETILPQRLASLGYVNHHIGKWHAGHFNSSYLPTNRGYHSFFGFHTGQMNYYTKHKCEVVHKKPAARRICGYDLWQNTHVYKGSDSITYSTHLFTQRAVDVIKHHRYSNNKPFFMTLAYQAVHAPLQAPKECIDLNPDIHDRDRRIYAGIVSCLDQGVGNITEALIRLKLWDNTVVIFTTDNGGYTAIGGSNWPLRGEKNTLFQGGIRAVGFVASPLLNNRRRISSDLLHITDWYPTIVSLAGGSPPDNLDGYDMWDLLSNNMPTPRTELLLYMNTRRKGQLGMDQPTQYSAAYRDGDWKLIIGDPGNGSHIAPRGSKFKSSADPSVHNKSVWLFNVRSDPREINDLTFQYPVITKKIFQKLQKFYKNAKPIPKLQDTMTGDPARHGGAWGPWDLKSPVIDYHQYIGSYNVASASNPISKDKKAKAKLKIWEWLASFLW